MSKSAENLDPIVKSYIDKLSKKHGDSNLELEMLKSSFKLAIQMFIKKYDDLPQGEQWVESMASVLDMPIKDTQDLVNQFKQSGWLTIDLEVSTLGQEILNSHSSDYSQN